MCRVRCRSAGECEPQVLFVSSENDVQPARKRSKLLGNRFPSFPSEDDGVHFAFCLAGQSRAFEESHVGRQSPRHLVVSTNATLLGGSNDD